MDDFRDLFESLSIPEGVRKELQDLTPAAYNGFASEMVDDIPER
jgi:hypothetical protein